MAYIDDLFGKLAADHCDLDVFIETKSNLQKQQIKTLAAGGVKCMQPGLESLSLTQLRAMDKGVTPMQNIVCLKWSLYYHVTVSWNILLGFPGETNEDYQRQTRSDSFIASTFNRRKPPANSGSSASARISRGRKSMASASPARGWPTSMCTMSGRWT